LLSADENTKHGVQKYKMGSATGAFTIISFR
jgi:hypothetical protein